MLLRIDDVVSGIKKERKAGPGRAAEDDGGE